MKRWTWTLASCAAAAAGCWITLHPFTGSAQTQSTNDPQYTSGGNLMRPKDFHTWVFVGSNLGLGYDKETTRDTPREAARADLGEYHNIYLKPEDYAAYVRTGTFPDKTVLVMDVYRPQTRTPTAWSPPARTTACRSASKSRSRTRIVRTGARPTGPITISPIAPAGDNFRPTRRRKPTRTATPATRRMPDFDNVWVQFYPVIRDVTPELKTNPS